MQRHPGVYWSFPVQAMRASAVGSGSSRPCDGDSVFCIGGVSLTGAYAFFSSRGPSADGRVKPNVSAVAASVQVANGLDVPVPANGTSFSSPTIAGLMACAWQKYPSKTNWELMKAVEFISNRYWAPDSLTGYGIPDFSRIDELLRAEGAISERRIFGGISQSYQWRYAFRIRWK